MNLLHILFLIIKSVIYKIPTFFFLLLSALFAMATVCLSYVQFWQPSKQSRVSLHRRKNGKSALTAISVGHKGCEGLGRDHHQAKSMITATQL